MLIYLVEDDPSILELEEYALQAHGYETRGFAEGGSFFAACDRALPDLVILDVMLPGEDGYALLRRLRRTPGAELLPVVMVTARGSELDVVKGLDQGADDYITKPFGVLEFVSRIKAVLRRADRTPVQLSFGSIRMEPAARQVTVEERPVELTYKEFELLHLFLQNPGQVLSREQIMQQVWDTDFCGEGEAGGCILTVRKVGYRLAAPSGEGAEE